MRWRRRERAHSGLRTRHATYLLLLANDRGLLPVLNVLLMLSTKQPPDPDVEVAWHHAESQKAGTTWLVTTRDVRGLHPGSGTVALYGDAGLRNRYLGRGTYRDYALLTTARGMNALSTSDLYRQYGYPASACAMIELSDVVVAGPAGGSFGSLGGTIRASGLPLTLANLPNGAARIQVYYLT